MKVSTNQKTIDRETRATGDIKSAKARPITGSRFERRFCGVLIALIFATLLIVLLRLDGLVAFDSANGPAQEKPRTLQRTAAAAWLKEHDFIFNRTVGISAHRERLERSPFLNRLSANPKTKERNQMMKFADRQTPIDGAYPQTKGEWLETRPGEHCLIRVSAKDTQGLYSLVEIVSNPGDGTPMHIHEKEDEYIAVLDGTARIAYGDKVFDSHAGEVVTLRKGIPHAWGNRSSAPLRIAVLASPGGVEEILGLIAKASRADIPALAERFHIRNIGPTPF